LSPITDEKFLKMLDSDTFEAGLKLATTAQPAIAPLSGLAMGITRGGDPQEPVGALEAQTKRRVLFENGELVTKREDSVCSAARVRKLEATSEKKATKRELIVVAPGSHEYSEPLHFQFGRSFR
jgi:hypothetical protein